MNQLKEAKAEPQISLKSKINSCKKTKEIWMKYKKEVYQMIIA
jgi:hypothetical protein